MAPLSFNGRTPAGLTLPACASTFWRVDYTTRFCASDTAMAADPRSAADAAMDAASLYREEIVTDRTNGITTRIDPGPPVTRPRTL